MSSRAESAHELPPPGFVAVGGRLLRHRITRGVGDAVVFVHGFGGSLESWQENFAALAATGRTVAALDLPGHGESSTDVGSGSLEELATALDELSPDDRKLVLAQKACPVTGAKLGSMGTPYKMSLGERIVFL